MRKEEQLLDQFQVEELEQRLEMERWSAGTTSHPDPDTGLLLLNSTHHIKLTSKLILNKVLKIK